MKVQQSDIVVCNNRLYRVHARPDGTVYTSLTPPSHKKGLEIHDSIPWVMTQEDITYTAGVRNVIFRDIFLEKPRISFSMHFDKDRYSRSYYPGAEIPLQEQIIIDHACVRHGGEKPLISVHTPVNCLSLRNCVLCRTGINFSGNSEIRNYGTTLITLMGCLFTADREMTLVENDQENKQVLLKTVGSTVINGAFKAVVNSGHGHIHIDSDLPGLD